MAKRRYVKIRETETTETYCLVWDETFWEKWVRRIKFLDRDDDVNLNKYSFLRRVRWTLNFYIRNVWVPRLRGQQLYRCQFTITMPKDRSKLGRIRHIKKMEAIS